MPATETRTVIFVSPCPNLSLTKVQPRHERRDVNNQVISDRVEREAVEFVAGRFETDDPEIIDWLRNHELLNRAQPNGFWEEGRSPDEPKPTAADQMSAIVRAVQKSDSKALEELLAGEEETHRRPAILAAARDAIDALSGGEPEGSESSEAD